MPHPRMSDLHEQDQMETRFSDLVKGKWADEVGTNDSFSSCLFCSDFIFHLSRILLPPWLPIRIQWLIKH